ncbi:MAG: cytochrome b5 domain-containing protein [Gammaproteobacteria bacterium]|nr:cytochrome b5 domain-containing protein [Gammaproteobacteria bacterium]
MKKLMYSAFIAFCASVATIVALDLLVPAAGRAQSSGAARRIDAAELARHGEPGDCWLAIDGKVYAVTDYVPSHPSAPEVVTRWCGREASEAFATKGTGRPHSASARASLEPLYVGDYIP